MRKGGKGGGGGRGREGGRYGRVEKKGRLKYTGRKEGESEGVGGGLGYTKMRKKGRPHLMTSSDVWMDVSARPEEVRCGAVSRVGPTYVRGENVSKS